MWLNGMVLLSALAMQLRQYKLLQIGRQLSHCNDVWQIEDKQGIGYPGI